MVDSWSICCYFSANHGIFLVYFVPYMGHSCQMKASEWEPVRFYGPIRRVVHDWPDVVRKELGAVLTQLQKGESVGMPDLRPMPNIAPGAAEIRISDRVGTFRTFHVIHSKHGILVFHAFAKKTQKTPLQELETGKRRLREFLQELGD